MIPKANCPSCSGPLTFQCSVSLYAVCPFCRSLVLRKDLDVEKVGEVALLADDGTPVQIGTRGKFGGKPFTVVGRLQLEFPSGYWNEWHIDFGGDRTGWLGETQGIYAVTFRVQPREAMPAFKEIAAGKRVQVNGESFDVKDVQSARCVSGEGELPFRFEGGYEAPVVDLGGAGRRFATLDYSEEPPLVFVGENCEFDELQLQNLRNFEGW
jgi:hypothetical protein